MTPQGQLDPRMADRYIKSILKKMEDDPASLSLPEKRLIEKHSIHKQKATQIQRDLDSINSQITQAQARAKSLELQLQGEASKAENCMEILLSLKFEPDTSAAKPHPGERQGPATVPGNGKPQPKAEEPKAEEPQVEEEAKAPEEEVPPVQEEPQPQAEAQA